MLSIDDLAIFVTIAEELSITAAAKKLSMPKPTLSRRLAQYESALGKTLFIRSTRQLSLTEDGKQLFKLVRPAINEVLALTSLIQQPSTNISGLVKITATNAIGEYLLWPKLQLLSERYPALKVQLILSESTVNIIQDGIDLAVRMGELDDSELIARRMGSINRIVVATPSFLKQYTTPSTPDDLQAIPAIIQSKSRQTLQFEGHHKVSLNWQLACGNLQLVKQAVLNHKGFAILPDFMVSEALQKGTLKRLLPDYALIHANMSLVSAKQRYKSPALSAVIECLLES